MSKIKKLVLFLCTICFCALANADTLNVDWFVDGETYSSTTCDYGGDVILPDTPTKYGYTFVGWRRPARQIEYLESTGNTQTYIDTGISPIYSSTKIKIDATLYTATGTFGTSGILFGVTLNNDQNTVIGIGDWSSADLCGFMFGGNYTNSLYASGQLFTWGTRHTFVLSRNEQSVDGLQVQNAHSYAFPDSNKTIFLFAYNMSSASAFAKARVYSFQIYNNNILIMDLVPVLDDNDVPCMYDRVTDQFFYNAGTGDFIAGPIIGEL